MLLNGEREEFFFYNKVFEKKIEWHTATWLFSNPLIEIEKEVIVCGIP